ncbi:DUF4007 family protein [Sphingobacterium lactis]|uniref:DUF4007 domain-containing protein n=1 Tax=Sphingobacterium lactis TaxID=797291 RepID=A0A1H5TXG4_9SPHI|nr:DUF4007 family protein [Sphingobacterium lactis]SEF67459.1 Protein of unknown function [Sphingobacterium lactis]
MSLRFSGHDTFHCKQQWLLKGIRLIEEEGNTAFNNTSDAIKTLGVGKNMVSSVKYWLESFNITNNHKISQIGKLLLSQNGFDPYLEDEGTLWLLQFHLCHSKYASIFNLIFCKYFNDKVNYDFTEEKILNFLKRHLEDNNIKAMSSNTLSNDFKVFTRSYVSSVRESKTLEDDFNSPLLELNLIEKSDNNTFKINKTNRIIPPNIFAYSVLLICESENSRSLSFRLIQETIGNYFCLSNDSLEEHIHQLNFISPLFVYNEDAGTANIQIKDYDENDKVNLLRRHYEN